MKKTQLQLCVILLGIVNLMGYGQVQIGDDIDIEVTSVSLFDNVTVMVKGGLGFSPNGDTWIIENIEDFPNNTVQVFNQWRELMFEANNYQNNWSGVFNKISNSSKRLPIGAYLYIINLNEAGFSPKTGWIYK